MTLLAVALWTAIEIWACVLNYLHGIVLTPEYWPGEIPMLLSGVLVSLAHWRAVRWASRRSRPVLWMVTVVTVLLSGMVYACSLRLLQQVTPLIMPDRRGDFWSGLLWDTIYHSNWFVLWVAIVATMESERVARRREQQLAGALIAAREAEIRALHYQINPHFLYNTLNALSTLIVDRRNTLAEAVVMRLAAFFRGALARDPLADVRLADEIALQQLYLEIEEVRFADALRVTIDVPQPLHDALVPSLILQPLIENAVKHGVNDPECGTLIAIRAWAAGDRLMLEVSDDGPGSSMASGTGVGLDNVHRRLVARFGARSGLNANAEPGRGFVVTLTLPLDFAPEKLAA
ncbi:sensor histidine kinase [Caulobacter sp. NIBR2454]|uniref:sensor histidine kinase n=1 Tax=Caulobacter sp. NIBR2454 TaxID=3015996 RepID=UPI0022B72793|nr:histidine kinase [Caulobacter sp. NIBR2454]